MSLQQRQAQQVSDGFQAIANGDVNAFKKLDFPKCVNKLVRCVSLLHAACEKGNLEIVKNLLGRTDIDVNFGVGFLFFT